MTELDLETVEGEVEKEEAGTRKILALHLRSYSPATKNINWIVWYIWNEGESETEDIGFRDEGEAGREGEG